MMHPRPWIAAAAVAATAALTACGPHTLQGRVIEGDASYVVVVDRHDERLQNPGIEGVLLRTEIDPGRINRRTLEAQSSDSKGDFALPIDEFGAGLIELDLSVLARRRGYKSAEGVFRVPSESKRVLIVLAPGFDPPGAFEQEPSIREQYERFR